MTSIQTSIKNSLLIGCDYEGSPNELKGCSNDVYMVRELLNTMNYKSSLLCDDKERNLHDVIDIPTSINIIKQIEIFCDFSIDKNIKSRRKIRKLKREKKSLFFHYSGHGSSIFDRNGDEKDRKDEIIIPVCKPGEQQTFITDDQLNQYFSKISENTTICCLFDACFSGTVLDLKYTLGPNGEDLLDNDKDLIKCDIIMISGCTDAQTSADAWISEEMNDGSGRRRGDFNGAMTASFLDTFKKFGTNIAVKEFIEHMREYLKKGGYVQIPQLSYSKPGACNKLMSHYIN